MTELREPDSVYENSNYRLENWETEVTVTVTVSRYVYKDGSETRWDYTLPNGEDSDEWYDSYDEALEDVLWRVGAW